MVETPEAGADQALKARHRALWAMGDYGAMVELMLLPLGTRLVEACAIGPGMRVLDVAAGTGNAALQAAAVGADVVASDLTPSLLEVGRTRAATPPASGGSPPAGTRRTGGGRRRARSPRRGRTARCTDQSAAIGACGP